MVIMLVMFGICQYFVIPTGRGGRGGRGGVSIMCSSL